jgi:hypothetical protein
VTEAKLTLAAQLRSAAHELGEEPLPPNLLGEIHRSLDRRRAARVHDARRGPGRAWRWAGLGTAFAALFAWMTVSIVAGPDEDADTTLRAGGFVPVAASERWQSASNADGAAWLVATELTPERLASLGLPYDPGRAGQPVRAQLLMHSSGDVLAVRVIDEETP